MASSVFGEAAEFLADQTGIDELVLGIFVLVSALTIFGPLCGALGGALFNPINSIAMISSGRGTALGHVIRMLGQMAGALAGTVAAKRYLPEFLHGKFHMLSGGIKEGVAFELGFACEGTMSFVLNYVFLISQEADSRLMTLWTPMLSTVVLSWVGYYFTGPSLNPFVSFAWHMHHKRQNDLEHYLVFWSAPILGALVAGLVYASGHRAPGAPSRKVRKPSKSAIAARKAETQLILEREAAARESHGHGHGTSHGHVAEDDEASHGRGHGQAQERPGRREREQQGKGAAHHQGREREAGQGKARR
ncbi:hypothetical protein HYH03_005734 [Edaphochlamys debaryana]|uniref:Aquaporin n=1 Tax=Edaphochlamys debaryana TaxID=47281 RepID=A0A835Y8G1_9CHLO|nr:hypothetical protein HYH03_005734 [Edaphochlamys debaryana]|eukprot:KAG2496131.1 hypothetical protein HYH03_005734 [Edaphochlamys debaryana]